MPVIQCLGSFLGMTASSLSVSILIARSSSFTLAHSVSFGGSARTDPAPAIAMTNPHANWVKEALESLMSRPLYCMQSEFAHGARFPVG